MKLYVVSDFHLEDSPFAPPARTVAAADVIVLASDSNRYARVVSNPRGVPHWDGQHENQNFNPSLLISQFTDGNWAAYVKSTRL